jgi:hypothetical protein
MDPANDPGELSTCTTCTMADDFSNYWTAVMYFRARNGTYKRVKQLGVLFFEDAHEGGMKIYYFAPRKNTTRVVAFRKGFRMRNGSPNASAASQYQGIDYTCLLRDDTRYTNRSVTFPAHPCPEGILTTIYFPNCWDGVNLDSPDHHSHVAWPVGTTFVRGAPQGDYDCPATHPVVIPQILLEIRWDTREFNAPELWPEDGSQPFVWSFGDRIGYGHHGDYVFGWRGDALQRAFDYPPPGKNCDDRGCGVAEQAMSEANKCLVKRTVGEPVDGWLDELPGGIVVDS